MPVTNCDRCGRAASPAYRLLIGPADRPQSDPIVRAICGLCVLAITRPLLRTIAPPVPPRSSAVHARPVRMAHDAFRRSPA